MYLSRRSGSHTLKRVLLFIIWIMNIWVLDVGRVHSQEITRFNIAGDAPVSAALGIVPNLGLPGISSNGRSTPPITFRILDPNTLEPFTEPIPFSIASVFSNPEEASRHADIYPTRLLDTDDLPNTYNFVLERDFRGVQVRRAVEIIVLRCFTPVTTLANGIVSFGGTQLGDSITYTCNPDFRLGGPDRAAPGARTSLQVTATCIAGPPGVPPSFDRGPPICERAAPDLAVSARFSPLTAIINQTDVDIAVTTRNMGTEVSSEHRLRFYRSDDPEITPDDDEIPDSAVSHFISIPDLGVGEDTTIFTRRFDTLGDAYYGVCVERVVPPEFNVDNNCSVGVLASVTATPGSVIATLSALSISEGALEPNFQGRTTLDYNAYVPNAVESLTVTPTTTVTGATITVDGRSVASGGASNSIMLRTGTNIIPVVVTITGGERRIYTLAVTRGPPAPDLTVSARINTSRAIIFQTDVRATVTLRNIGSIPSRLASYTFYRSDDANITPDDERLRRTGVRIRRVNPGGELINEFPVVGCIDAGCVRVDGDNIIELPVIPDGIFDRRALGDFYYGVCIDQVYPPEFRLDTANNCSAGVRVTGIEQTLILSALSTSEGPLNPDFDGARTYNAAVASTVTSLTVTPTATNASARITVDGMPVTSGEASNSIMLETGANIIPIVVTIGAQTQAYTLTVTRARAEPRCVLPANPDNGTIFVSDVGRKFIFSDIPVGIGTAVGDVITYGCDFGFTGGGNATCTASEDNTTASYIPRTVPPCVASPPGTDLTVFSRLGTASGIIEAIVGIGITVRNIGIRTSTSYRVSIYRSNDAEITLDDEEIQGLTLSAGTDASNLAMDTETQLGFRVGRVGGDREELGNFYYGACVHRVTPPDINMGNNCSLGQQVIRELSCNTPANPANGRVTITGNALGDTATYRCNAGFTRIGDATATCTANEEETSASFMPAPPTCVALGTDANLSALRVSRGTLTPTFMSATLGYSVNVGNTVTSLTVTPTASDASATITVNGTTVASGNASGSINLVVGSNQVRVIVTAADAVTTQTYILNVTRAAPLRCNDPPNLNNGSRTFTGNAIGDTATYRCNTGFTLSGTATTTCTASGGGTSASFMPAPPTCVALGTDANLSALRVSRGTLTPTFMSARRDYSVNVGNTVTSLTVTPTASDASATITVNGTTVASGNASGSINLVVGSNQVRVIVTAADAVTTQTYILNVTRAAPLRCNDPPNLNNGSRTFTGNAIGDTATYRCNTGFTLSGTATTTCTASGGGTSASFMPAPPTCVALSADADLSALRVSRGTLTPTFMSARRDYSVNVGNTVTSLTVTPTASDAGAAIIVNGRPVASGNASGTINLAVGSNQVRVRVIAANTVTTQTYVLTVTRAEPTCNDPPNLNNGSRTFTGNAIGDTATYRCNPGFTLDGTATATCTASGDRTSASFMPAPPTCVALSADATLSALRVSRGTLTPTFMSARRDYSVNVGNTVTSLTVTPTASDAGATIAVNGTTVASGGASGSINLAVGSNEVRVIVTAADTRITQTYVLAVTRAEPPRLTGDTFTVDENVAGNVGRPLTASNFPAGTRAWTIVSGNTGGVFEINPTTGQLSLILSRDFESDPTSYTLTIRLVVGSAMDTADATINLRNVNESPAPPVVDPQMAIVGVPFSYSFAAVNDPDAGDTVSYRAALTNGNALPAWLTFTPTSRSFAGTPAAGDAGTLMIRATARDDAISPRSSTADFTLTVNAPTLTDDTFTVNENVTGNVGSPLTASNFPTGTRAWTIVSGNTVDEAFVINASTGQLSLSSSLNFETPPTSHTLILRLVVGGAMAMGTATINVRDVNEAPILSSQIPDPDPVEAGSGTFPVNVAPHFGDVDVGSNGMLTFTIQSNSDVAVATATLTGSTVTINPLAAGTTTLTIRATDGGRLNVEDSFEVEVTEPIPNSAPTAPVVDPQMATVGTPFSYSFDAVTDPDVDDTVSYRAALTNGNDLPAWLTFTSTSRNFAGTPATGDAGVLTIRVTAMDDDALPLSSTADFTLTVNAPTLTDETFTVDENVPGDVGSPLTASNFPTGTQAWTIESGNTGDVFAINAMTGQLSLISELNFESGPTSYTLILRLVVGGAMAMGTATINVRDVNEAPTLSSAIPDPDPVEAGSGTFPVNVAPHFGDMDVGSNGMLTFTIQSNSDVAVATAAVALSTVTINPLMAGTTTLTIRATDGGDMFVQDSFEVEVTAPIPNSAPMPPVVMAQMATAGVPFIYTFDAVIDPDTGDTVSYSAALTDGSLLPAWLTFTPTSRSFTGTPAADDDGMLTIRVTAMDDDALPLLSTADFTLTVNAPTLTDETFTVDENVTGNVGSPLTANNFMGGTQAWTIVSGNTGNVFNINTATGQLSLISELNFESGPTSYTLILRLVVGGAMAMGTATINVRDVNEAPTLSSEIPDSGPVEAGSGTFIVDVASHFEDLDEGSNGMLTFTVENNSDVTVATAAVALSTVTINPLMAGTTTLTIRATDGGDMFVEDNFNVEVTEPIPNNAPEAPVVMAQIATVDTAFIYTFAAVTDPDTGDTVSYSAALTNGNDLPAWLTFTSTSRTFAGTPGAGDDGTLTIRVTARDDAISPRSSTADFTLTVNAPMLTDETFTVAENVISDVGSPLAPSNFMGGTQAWTIVSGNTGDVFDINATTGQLSLSSSLDFESDPRSYTLTLQLVVGSASAMGTATINVLDVNEAPTLSSPIPDPAPVAAGSGSFTVDVAPHFEDLDAGPNGELTFTVEDNSADTVATAAVAASIVTITPLTAGTTTLTIRATDGATDSVPLFVEDNFEVVVTVPIPNNAPAAPMVMAQMATVGTPFSYTFATVMDPDVGDTVSYSAALTDGNDLPAWLTFTPTGRTFAGMPAVGDVGMLTIRVTAMDDAVPPLSSTADFTLTVNAPTLTDETFTVDENVTVDVGSPLTASNFMGGTQAWTIVSGNTGNVFDINATTGQLSLSSSLDFESDPRSYTLTLQLIVGSAMAMGTATINVLDVNELPILRSEIPDPDPVAAGSGSFIVDVDSHFEDLDAGPNGELTFTVEDNSADTVATAAVAASIVTITPLTAGTTTLTIRATDGATDSVPLFVEDNFEVVVTVPIPNNAPAAPMVMAQMATVGTPFSYTFATVMDPDVGDTVSYSAALTDGNDLPAWLTFTPTGRTFAGMPAVGDVGMLTIRVTAMDDASPPLSSTADFTLTVNAPTLTDETFTVAENVSGDVGSPLTAINFMGGDQTWTIESGNTGDVFDIDAATGQLSLSSSLNFEAPPISYTLTLQLAVGSAMAMGTATIDVLDVNEAPTLSSPIPDPDPVAAGSGSFIVDVDSHFEDLDAGPNGELTFTVEDNSADTVATAAVAASIVTITPLTVGTTTLTIRATDGATDSVPLFVEDNFEVVVTAPIPGNQAPAPPVVDPQTATVGMLFDYIFDEVIDPDTGDTVSYSAALTDGGSLPTWLTFTPTNRSFTGTPAVGDVGMLTIRVTAMDDAVPPLSSTADFTLTVNAPTLTDETFTVAENVTVDVGSPLTASNFMGGTQAWTIVSGNTGDVFDIDAATGQLSLSSSLDFESDPRSYTLTLQLVVAGASAMGTATINVLDVNEAPTLRSEIPDPAPVAAGSGSFTVDVAPHFEDLDAGSNGMLTFTIQSNSDVAVATAALTANEVTINPLMVGTTNLTIRATDGGDMFVEDNFNVEVTVPIPNNAPAAPMVMAQMATVGTPFSYTFATVMDPDVGDTVSYSAALTDGNDLPAWLTFTPTGRSFTGMPAVGDVGMLTIRVTAMDDAVPPLSSTADFTLTVNAPTLTDETFTVDENVTVDVGSPLTASNFMGGTQAWTIVSGNTGDVFDINATTGQLSLSSSLDFESDPRSYTLTLQLVVAGASAMGTATINVLDVNELPILRSEIPDPAPVAAGSGSFTVDVAPHFEDLDAGSNGMLTFTIQSNSDVAVATAALTANEVTINPLMVGTTNLTIRATDGGDMFVEDNFNVEVTVPIPNNAPAAPMVMAQMATVGTPFSYTFATVMDPDVGDTVSYSAALTDGNDLPAWLTFTPTGRTFAGMPAVGDVGMLTIRVTAMDDAVPPLSSTADFTLTVNAPTLTDETFTVAENVTVDVGSPLTASNFMGGTQAWTIVSGNTGDVFDIDAATGQLSLSSSLDFESDPRSYTLILQLVVGSASAMGTATINVLDVNEAPTLRSEIPDPAPVAAGSGSFTVDVAPHFEDLDAGSNGMLTFTIQSNSDVAVATAALTANEVTINPLMVGTTNLTIRATDGGDMFVEDNFNVEVTVPIPNNAPAAPMVMAQMATVGTPFSYTFATVMDPDVGDTVSYSAALTDGNDLPAWLTFTPTGRTFAGMPAVGDVGMLTIRVTAMDDASPPLSSTADFTLTVNAPTLTDETFTVAENVSGDVGSPLTAINFMGGDQTWTIESGNTGDVFDIDAATGQLSLSSSLNFEAPPISYTLTLQLAVGSAMAMGTATIDVLDVNEAPTLISEIPDPAPVAAGSGSFIVDVAPHFEDLDAGSNGMLTFTVEDNSADTVATAAVAASIVTITPLTAGTTTLTIRATDGATDSVPLFVEDNFEVVVTAPIPGNQAPAPPVVDPQTATVGMLFDYIFDEVIDPDTGDTVSYSAALTDGGSLPAWLTFTPTNRSFTGTPAVGDVGMLTIRVTAMDDAVPPLSSTADFTLTVNAPTLTDETFTVDENVTVDVGSPLTASNFMGGTQAWTIVSGNTGDVFDINATTGQLSLSSSLDFESDPRSYTLILQLVVAGASAMGTATINVLDVNEAPTLRSEIPDPAPVAAGSGSFTVDVAPHFEDLDAGSNGMLTFTIQSNSDVAVATAALTANEVTINPLMVGTTNLTIRATDGGDMFVEDNFNVEVTVPGVNRAPAPPVVDPQTATVGMSFDYTFDEVDDPDAGDTVSYSAALTDGGSLPTWLTFTPTSLSFTGTPEAADAGTLTIRVTAMDDASPSRSSTADFTLTVNAPTLTGDTFTVDENVAGNVGSPLTASNFPTGTQAWTIESGNTGGVFDIDATTGQLSLSSGLDFETAPTSYTLTIQLVVGSAMATADATINVRDVNEAPAAPVVTPQTATVSVPFNYSFDAVTDPDAGDTVRYSAALTDGNALPAWLTFTSASLSFTGTPEAADAGALTIRVTARDDDASPLSSTADFTLTVSVAGTPTLTGDTFTVDENVAGNVGSPLTASNFPTGTQAWTIESGNTGGVFDIDATTGQLSLSSGLDFETAPTSYTLTIQLVVGSAMATADATINVRDVNEAPAAPVVTPQTATVSIPFSYSFDAVTDPDAGDTVGYSAALTDGSALPAWLTFTSTSLSFTGTPEAADAGALTIRVTARDDDASPLSSTADFTLTVSVAGTPTLTGDTFTVDENVAGNVGSPLTASNFPTGTQAWTIESGNTGGVFDIDATTGQLSLSSGLDFETAPTSYTLTIQLVVGSAMATADATINVRDVNEAPAAPVVTPQTATVSVPFNYSFDAVTDPDAGDTVRYSAALTDGNALPAWLTFTSASLSFTGTPEAADAGALTIRVTARDDDASPLSSTADFTLTVSVAGTPTLTGDTFTVDENVAGNVGSPLTASNFPTGTQAWTIESGNTGGVFDIDATTGQLSLSSGLDFETAPTSYTLTIQLVVGSAMATADATINVRDVNEAPAAPVVTPQTATVSVPFNYSFDAVTDPDAGDTVGYSAALTDGSALPAWLTFTSASLSFTGTPEAADAGALTIRVTARDDDASPLSSTADFTLTVSVAGTPTLTGDTFTVDENVAGNVGSPLTASNFPTGTQAWTIESGNTGGVFDIDATTGQLSLSSGLDFETAPTSYTLTIQLVVGSAMATADATINVRDVNEAPAAPVVTPQTATVSIPFNYSFDAVTDPDAGDTVRYSAALTDGNALPAWLTFTSASLSFTGTPAAADAGALTIRVTARDDDASPLSSTADFTLTVSVAGTPTLTGDTFTVDENVAGNVGSPLTASNFPTGTQAWTIESGNTGGVFDIDATTGQLSLSSGLDFETAPTSYTLTIQLVVGSAMATADATINVRDVNEAPAAPVVTPQTATVSVPFNYSFDAVTDPDAGDTVRYSAALTDGNALPAWLTFTSASLSFTGTPAAADAGALTIRVTARDDDASPLSSTADFTLTVSVAGTPTLTGDTFTVDENVAGNVGSPLTASNFPTGTQAWTIESGNTGGVFDIDATTGQLSLSSGLDFETAPTSYTLTIQLVVGSAMATADATINVRDVNEAPAAPVVTPQTATVSVPFNYSFDAVTDPDAGDTVRYSAALTDGNALPAWLTFTSASLSFTGTPAAADAGALTIRVTARDDDALPLSSTADFTLTVSVAGTPTLTGDTFTVDENVAGNVGSPLTASNFPTGTQAWTIESGNTGGVFDIDATTGQLSLSSGLDFETAPTSYTLTIQLVVGSAMATADATINVRDVNEAPAAPVVTPQTATVSIPFNYSFDAVTDPDAGDTVGYSAALTDGNALPAWLTFTSASLSFTGTPAAADAGALTIRVTARDDDALPLSSTADFTLTVSAAGTPTLTGDTFTVDENVAGNVGSPLTASNFPTGTQAWTIESGNTGGVFDIDATTGQLSLSSGLDFETAPTSYTLTIQLVVGSAMATADATINVRDVNEAPAAPVVTPQTATVSVPFNYSFDAVTDPDAGDTVRYSAALTDGNALPAWLTFTSASLSFTGTPAAADAGALTIRVTARDDDALPLSSTADFTLTVSVAGTPTLTGDTFTVDENVAGNVGSPLTASNFPTGTQAWTIESGNTGGVFDIDATTGQLSLSSGLDFETAPTSYTLTIQLVVGSAMATADATINVRDVNEAPTLRSEIPNPAPVAAGSGSFTVDVAPDVDPHFDDVDAGTNGMLTFTVQSNSAEAVATATLAATEVVITPLMAGMTTLTILATDGGGMSVQDVFDVVVTEPIPGNQAPAPPVVTPQTATVGMLFSYSFAEVTDPDAGDTVGYSAALTDGSALPAWLTFTPTSLSFTGTPEAGDAGALTIRVTARDDDALPLSSIADFILNVLNEAPMIDTPVEERPQALITTLATFGRTVASNLIGIIEDRTTAIQSKPQDGGSQVTVAGKRLSMEWLKSALSTAHKAGSGTVGGRTLAPMAGLLGLDDVNAGGVGFREINLRQLLTESSFQLALNGDGGKAGSWTLWGRSSMSRFDGRLGSDFSVDGEVMLGQIGLDLQMDGNILAGLAVNYSEGDNDYSFTGGTQGEVDIWLTSAHPYLHWSGETGLDLWLMLGYGQGHATLEDDAGEGNRTDLAMGMVATGARQELETEGYIKWALKADGFFTSIDTDAEADNELGALDADTWRLRLGLESTADLLTVGDTSLKAVTELGWRLDGGDAETGMGAEISGGLNYAHPGLGLNMSARGHYLLAHRDSDFEEWGASFAATLDPGTPELGLQLSLTPSLGAATSGGDRLWQDQHVLGSALDGLTDATAPVLNMQAEAAYGLSIMHDRGRLTPFSVLDLSDRTARARLGTRMRVLMPRRLDIGLAMYGEQNRRTETGEGTLSGVLDSRIRRSFAHDMGVIELFGKMQTGGEDAYQFGLDASFNF